MKKLFKRFLALVLTLCTVTTMVMPACAEVTEGSAKPSASLSVSAKYDSAKDQIAVTISLDKGANLTGAQVCLNYDKSNMEYDSFTPGNLLPGGDIAENNKKDGYVSMIFGGWATDAKEEKASVSGVLGTVVFNMTSGSVRKTEFSLSDGYCTNYNGDSADATLAEALTFVVRADVKPQGNLKDGAYVVDHGSYTVDKTVVAVGDTVTVTTKPDKNYEVAEVVVNDGAVKVSEGKEEGTYTFVMPSEDAVLTVTFQPITYAINLDKVENGTVTVTVNGKAAERAAADAVVTITMTANNGYLVEAPKVTYQAIGENRTQTVEVEVTAGDKEGTYTFKMPAAAVTVSASFAAEAVVNPFTDVKESDYFYDAVMWGVKNKVVAGTSETTFSPNADCTRGQIVSFLWRAAGSPEPKSTTSKFTDLDPNQYYYKPVLWAAENGIVAGMTDTTFEPNTKCRREHIVAILWRYMGEPAPKSNKNPFTDVKSSDYFYKAVLWGAENGVVYGMTDTTFGPKLICNRAQAVSFLYRAENLK